MSRQLRISGIDPRRELKPDRARQTPVVWISRLQIRRSLAAGDEHVIRDIELRRGLNIIWAPPADSEEENALEQLVDYCNTYAEAYLLQDSTWYKVEDIAMEMPKVTVTPDNVSAKQEFSQRDGEYQYYFRVFEVKNRKDIAPLGYIEEQARKVILRSRREKLLAEKIEAMYQRELRRNNIQTYY